MPLASFSQTTTQLLSAILENPEKQKHVLEPIYFPQLALEKLMGGFGKNAVEWTRRVELARKKSLEVSVAKGQPLSSVFSITDKTLPTEKQTSDLRKRTKYCLVV